MSNPLAEYLSALAKRDEREKASKQVIDQYTRLADRTAQNAQQAPPEVEGPAKAPSPSATPSTSRTLWSGTPKPKSSPTPQENTTSTVAQLRTELAAAHKTRSNLEAQLATVNAELSELKTTSSDQKKRIERLERIKKELEQRVKDRADEIKGKARFVDDMQDEAVALNLQLNVAEKERDRLKAENAELTRRWMEKMEQEADTMNARNDERWKDSSGRRRK